MLQVAGHLQQPASDMAQNEEEDDEQMSDSDEMPYIKCEAVYGEEGDDDGMSALPFLKTEMKEDDDNGEERMKYGMKAPEVGAYVKCSVPSCHSYFEVGNPKYEGFSHFKFPEDQELRKRWISIIGQKEDWEPEGAMLCSIHFTDGCFINVMEANQDTGLMMAKRTLKKGAVPTMNLEVPNSWSVPRVVLPPSTNGSSPLPGVPTSAVTAARSLAPAPAAVPSPNTVRSPYCQGEPSTITNTEDYYPGRTITLTKNGKRRGRPPKNRLLEQSPFGSSPIGNTTITPSPTQLLKAAQTVVMTPTTHTNGQSKTSNYMPKFHPSYANQAQQMYNKNLPPFQILDMGKRKRGRPRKEETLRRLAEGAAENVFGWRNQQNHWQRNTQIKRRKILPTTAPQDPSGRVVQLECNIDPGHFFMNEEPDCNDVDYCDRELAYFRKLPNILANAGLNSSSLSELRTIVQAAVERLSAAELVVRKSAALESQLRNRSLSGGASISVRPSTTVKDRLLDVDVRIPPSVSIKPVTMKSRISGSGNGAGSSTASEEELKPALTITIRRDKGSSGSGSAILNGMPPHEVHVEDDKKASKDVEDDENKTPKEEVGDTLKVDNNKGACNDSDDDDDEGELMINEDAESDSKTSEDGKLDQEERQNEIDDSEMGEGQHEQEDDQPDQDNDHHEHDNDQHDQDENEHEQDDQDDQEDEQDGHHDEQDNDHLEEDDQHEQDGDQLQEGDDEEDDGSVVDSSIVC